MEHGWPSLFETTVTVTITQTTVLLSQSIQPENKNEEVENITEEGLGEKIRNGYISSFLCQQYLS